MKLRNKKILLGVSGSIAAYKAANLVRLLKKQGAEVRVVMTASALDFITPLTLATLSEQPVYSSFVKNSYGEWVNHVEYGIWADHIIIAPASANTIAKLAHGICDNLLCAIVLSARCKLSIAPAMDLDMIAHPSTVANIETLKKFGYEIIETEYGELASGLVGNGRMAEPEQIISNLENYFSKTATLVGKKILITAGPTQEPLDPVRYITNHSTGKMGYAIAEQAAYMGAEVVLISGPVQIDSTHGNIKLVKVKSADEMYEQAMLNLPSQDIIILSAAVADYRPKNIAHQKIKKSDTALTIELEKTKDIAAEIGNTKRHNQFLVGFALETENELENAKDKLIRKKLDMIVLNSTNDFGATFGTDTNKITIIDKSNNANTFPLKSKKLVAKDILDTIVSRLEKNNEDEQHLK